MTSIKKIGLLTSGGDAPGMNAVIRAVTRTALMNNIEVTGIVNGYAGLFSKEFINLNALTVSNIEGTGGTILRSSRCKEMMTDEGRDKAANICKEYGIDALVVIGGDGSLTGAQTLAERGISIMGIPGTIDLDLACSEYTIGFDTALKTASDAISCLIDTSNSHERCSVVEVMGRNCGSIAIWSAIASGADIALVPEVNDITTEDVIKKVKHTREKGKKFSLIVVAEGVGGSVKLAKDIEENTGIESRATVLGHIQRGGHPTVLDRVYAAIMGNKAVQLLINGETNKIITVQNGKCSSIDLEEGLKLQKTKKKFDKDLYDVINTLSI